jgi:DNA-binding transcriptional MocR family regulator
VNAAAERGLALAAFDRYVLTENAAARNRLVLGYGNITPAAIGPAVRLLTKAIGDCGGR